MTEKRHRKKPRRATIAEVGEKPWYQSVGIWGGILSIFAPVAAAVGTRMTEADASELSVQLAGIGAAVGGILAIIGRIRSSGVITK